MPTPRPNPESEEGRELTRKCIPIVRDILSLPVNRNSSALKEVDAWEIAKYIVADRTAFLTAIMPEKTDPTRPFGYSYQQEGFNNCIDEINTNAERVMGKL